MKIKFVVAFLLFSLCVGSSFAEFYLSGGPLLALDYDATKESAPAPIVFSGSAGGILRSDKTVAIDFGVSFFMNYYDCTSDKQVIYTEIENRTALALSFMADCTARYNKNFGKSRIMVGGGLGILARFGIKDDSVPADEDWKMDEINTALWANASFLYPELAFTWLYDVSDVVQAGLELKAYIGIEQTMISLAAKVAFGKHNQSAAVPPTQDE